MSTSGTVIQKSELIAWINTYNDVINNTEVLNQGTANPFSTMTVPSNTASTALYSEAQNFYTTFSCMSDDEYYGATTIYDGPAGVRDCAATTVWDSRLTQYNDAVSPSNADLIYQIADQGRIIYAPQGSVISGVVTSLLAIQCRNKFTFSNGTNSCGPNVDGANVHGVCSSGDCSCGNCGSGTDNYSLKTCGKHSCGKNTCGKEASGTNQCGKYGCGTYDNGWNSNGGRTKGQWGNGDLSCHYRGNTNYSNRHYM